MPFLEEMVIVFKAMSMSVPYSGSRLVKSPTPHQSACHASIL